MVLKIFAALIIGCLVGWLVDYILIRTGLTKEEWIYLKTFYEALCDGRYKKVDPKEEDEDGKA